jgi:ribosome-associated heat shock protein Hsp15
VADGTRVDKWLWAARFFKTRALARAAVAGGKVELDGRRVKPGRTLQVGNRLTIRRGDETWVVTVMDLEDRRVSAADAISKYAEDQQAREQRLTAAEERRQAAGDRAAAGRRPDKNQRRKIIDFTRRRG